MSCVWHPRWDHQHFVNTSSPTDNSLGLSDFRPVQEGPKVVAPDWNACLEYEFQLRKQAFKLIRETRLSIGEALQSAYNDPQDRMTHWNSLLAIANGQEEHESQEVAGLKRRLAAVEKAQGRPAKAQKTAPHQGSVYYSFSEQSGKGSKGKSKGKSSKGGKSGRGRRCKGKAKNKDSKAPSTQMPGGTFRKFAEISKQGARKHYHFKDREAPWICYKFQRHACDDSSCTRQHICVECGKPGLPYDDCGCLESTV